MNCRKFMWTHIDKSISISVSVSVSALSYKTQTEQSKLKFLSWISVVIQGFVFNRIYCYCFMRRHICSMARFSYSLFHCTIYIVYAYMSVSVCIHTITNYAWMSVSLLSIFRFNWIQSEAHSYFKMRRGRRVEGSKAENRKKQPNSEHPHYYTITIASTWDFSLVFASNFPPLFMSPLLFMYALHAYTCSYLSVHKHYPYSSILAKHSFVCEIFFLFFICLLFNTIQILFFLSLHSLHLHCLFSNHSENIYTIQTTTTKNWEKSDMHTLADSHTYIHRQRENERHMWWG